METATKLPDHNSPSPEPRLDPGRMVSFAAPVVPLLVTLLVASLAVPASVSRASSPLDPFAGDRVLVDLYGLGSFNRGAEGDFPGKVASSMVPPGFVPPAGALPRSGLQFSGRPGWGGGLGATMLPSRHFGVALDQSVVARSTGSSKAASADFGYLRHQTSASLVLRYPLPPLSVAPYALVGGGAQYGSSPRVFVRGRPPNEGNSFTLAGQGFFQLGAGAEVRLLPSLGVFSDLRWLLSGVRGLPSDQMQLRYGLRAAF